MPTQVKAFVLLLGLALAACGFPPLPARSKPAWAQSLRGWKKIFGFAAVLLVFLILLNPEFLALGLLGDTVFFDALVLVMSLQLQSVVARAWHCVRPVLTKNFGWVRIPSPGMRHLLGCTAVFIGSMVAVVQKIAQRISS